jgi:hypothetical protein
MLDDFYKDNMFKIADGALLTEGSAVVLISGVLQECSSAEDPACLGVLDAFHIETSDTLVSVEDCLGNEYVRQSNPVVEKRVQKTMRLGLIHTARLCDEGGAISAGDLLCTSTVPGRLKKQSDTTVHAHTVGQAIVAVTFSGGLADDQSIYLLG